MARHERQGTGDRGQRDVTSQEEDEEEPDSRGRTGERVEGQQGAQAGGHSLAPLEPEINREVVPEDRRQRDEDRKIGGRRRSQAPAAPAARPASERSP